MKLTLILDKSPSIDCVKNYDNFLDNFEIPFCIVCGREIKSYWDPRYKGTRASCDQCEINWAES